MHSYFGLSYPPQTKIYCKIVEKNVKWGILPVGKKKKGRKHLADRHVFINRSNLSLCLKNSVECYCPNQYDVKSRSNEKWIRVLVESIYEKV